MPVAMPSITASVSVFFLAGRLMVTKATASTSAYCTGPSATSGPPRPVADDLSRCERLDVRRAEPQLGQDLGVVLAHRGRRTRDPPVDPAEAERKPGQLMGPGHRVVLGL